MFEVRELDVSKDTLLWDRFVQSSPQGNLFSDLAWVGLFQKPYKIYACQRGNEIHGGIVGFADGDKFYSGGANVPFTPFQGVICRPTDGMKQSSIISLHDEIATSLIYELEKSYKQIEIVNHYTFPDIRPFLWHDYHPLVRYTYVVDISDLDKAWEALEKDTRYEIKQAEEAGVKVEWCADLRIFDQMYEETFKRKSIPRPPADLHLFQTLRGLFKGECYITDTSGVYVIKDDKRAYYIFGSSELPGHTSSLCLWHVMKEMNKKGYKEIDLVGCNDEKINLFKRGFGGQLRAYFGVSKV